MDKNKEEMEQVKAEMEKVKAELTNSMKDKTKAEDERDRAVDGLVKAREDLATAKGKRSTVPSAIRRMRLRPRKRTATPFSGTSNIARTSFLSFQFHRVTMSWILEQSNSINYGYSTKVTLLLTVLREAS